MASQDRADIYTRITAEIVAAIEAGVGEWRMPWHHDGASTARPVNVASRKGYRGVNVLALWIASQAAGYPTGVWGTYRQWQAAGAQVRKGERATSIVFWKTTRAEGADDADAEVERARFFARGYSVFNQAQADGYTAPDVPSCPRPSAWPTPRPSTPTSGSTLSMAVTRPTTFRPRIRCTCRRSSSSTMRQPITAPSFMKAFTPPRPSTDATESSPRVSARRRTRWKSASRIAVQP